MAAASIAFRTPLIGRNLYGMFRRAGFDDVRVQVLANADTVGGMKGVLSNMASYARTSGRIEDAEVDAWVEAQADFAAFTEARKEHITDLLLHGLRPAEESS